jgi:hypothetical protein
MKRTDLCTVLLLLFLLHQFLLHQDFWLWDDPTVLLGFLPIGLAYHALHCVATLFGCALVTLVGISLLTSAPSEETLRKFFHPAGKTALSGEGVAVVAD